MVRTNSRCKSRCWRPTSRRQLTEKNSKKASECCIRCAPRRQVNGTRRDGTPPWQHNDAERGRGVRHAARENECEDHRAIHPGKARGLVAKCSLRKDNFAVLRSPEKAAMETHIANYVALFCFALALILSGCDAPPAPTATAAPSAAPPPPPPPPAMPASSTGSSWTSEESVRIQEDFRRFTLASMSGDHDTVLKLVHPLVVESSGGKEKFREETDAIVKKHQSVGLTTESISFPSPPVFLKGSQHEFVVVPWTMIVSVKGRRAERTGSQLGVRRIGESSWAYMDGSGQDRAELSSTFPDFPADFQFPAASTRQLPSN